MAMPPLARRRGLRQRSEADHSRRQVPHGLHEAIEPALLYTQSLVPGQPPNFSPSLGQHGELVTGCREALEVFGGLLRGRKGMR